MPEALDITCPCCEAKLKVDPETGSIVWVDKKKAPPTLIQPGGDGRLTRTLGISLLGAPPGEYALALTVKDEKSGETLSRTEPFTVAP